MSINVIVNFNVKNNKISEFKNILSSVKTELPQVEGCYSVEIFKNTDAIGLFTLVETWETKQLHKNHISKLIEEGTWDFISGHLTAEPTSSYYKSL